MLKSKHRVERRRRTRERKFKEEKFKVTFENRRMNQWKE
jgi:hypothetical protein